MRGGTEREGRLWDATCTKGRNGTKHTKGTNGWRQWLWVNPDIDLELIVKHDLRPLSSFVQPLHKKVDGSGHCGADYLGHGHGHGMAMCLSDLAPKQAFLKATDLKKTGGSCSRGRWIPFPFDKGIPDNPSSRSPNRQFFDLQDFVFHYYCSICLSIHSEIIVFSFDLRN